MNFLVPSQLAKASEASVSRCVNMYFIKTGYNETYDFYVHSRPGLTAWKDLSSSNSEIRGMLEKNNVLYLIVDNKCYSSDKDGNLTELGTIGTSSGKCSISATHDIIFFHDKSKGYEWDITDSTFNEVTDTDFPGASPTMTAQDDYFFAHTGDVLYWSGLADARTWSALDFVTAEGIGEEIKAVYSFQSTVFVLGRQGTEMYFNTGDTTPWERLSRVLLQQGIEATDTLSEGKSNLYWLARGRQGNLSVITVDRSFNDVQISDDALNYRISTYSRVDDAEGFVFQREGKEFYQLNFPSEGKTWLYDADLQLWTELTSVRNEVEGRHLAKDHVDFAGLNLVSDFEKAIIYKLDDTAYTDNGERILRKIVTAPIINDLEDIRINEIEVDFQNNVGLVSGQGSTPQAVLRMSKDGGFTFGNHKFKEIGTQGKPRQEAKWRRLGSGDRIVFELTMSDPVRWAILGAFVDATGLNN